MRDRTSYGHKPWHTLTAALLGTGLVAAAPPACARDYTDLADMSLEQLVEMDVFTAANLLPTQTGKAPGTVYRFNASDFQRFGVRRLEDLLQFVPGIQLNQYRKRHQSIWARGLLQRYNDKFVLLIDGVRQQHLYYGHFALGDNLPLEHIEKVEVILGPASSLYGANAFSGLISITTKDFAPEDSFSASLELGSNDRQKVTGLYSSQRWQAFGAWLEQEAPFSGSRQSFIGEPTLQPLDEDYQNLYLKARLAPGLTGRLDYQRSETPFVFIPASQNAFIDTESWSAALNYSAGQLDSGRLETTLFYQQEYVQEYEYEQASGQLGYEESQDGTLAGLTATGLRRWGDHTLALGASWRYEEADDTRYRRYFRFDEGFLDPPRQGNLLSQPGIRNEDHAVYLQDVWAVNDAVNVTLGLRYDDFDQFGQFVNYRAAFNYSVNPRHHWKLMYGTAIRTPTLREYLKVLEGTAFTAPIPEAERIKTLELGYHYRPGPHLTGSLTLFRNNLRDFIYEQPTPDGADEYFTNLDERLIMHGTEAMLDYRPDKRWSLRATLAWVQAEDFSNYDELPYVAPWSGSLAVDYRLAGDHTLGLSLVYNNTRDTPGAMESDSDGFVLTNLHLRGQLTHELSYRLGIDNLLDEEVRDPASGFGAQHGTEKARRQLWLNLTWTPVF